MQKKREVDKWVLTLIAEQLVLQLLGPKYGQEFAVGKHIFGLLHVHIELRRMAQLRVEFLNIRL